MFIQTRSALMTALNDITTAIGGGATVHLYSNNYTPTPLSTVTNFTEADFTGYSAFTLTGGAAVTWQSQGAAVSWTIPQAVFNTASPYTVTQTVYGYYVMSAGMSPYLLGAEQFPAPVTMVGAGDQVIISVPINIRDAGIPGQIY